MNLGSAALRRRIAGARFKSAPESTNRLSIEPGKRRMPQAPRPAQYTELGSRCRRGPASRPMTPFVSPPRFSSDRQSRISSARASVAQLASASSAFQLRNSQG